MASDVIAWGACYARGRIFPASIRWIVSWAVVPDHWAAKRASCLWPIASFRCAKQVGRFQRIAGYGEPSTQSISALTTARRANRWRCRQCSELTSVFAGVAGMAGRAIGSTRPRMTRTFVLRAPFSLLGRRLRRSVRVWGANFDRRVLPEARLELANHSDCGIGNPRIVGRDVALLLPVGEEVDDLRQRQFLRRCVASRRWCAGRG